MITQIFHLEVLIDKTNEFPIEEDICLNYNRPPRTNREAQANENLLNYITDNPENNNIIIIDTSSKAKEELINDFDELIKNKKLEKSYIINGDDFTVIIKPVNSYLEEFTLNVDFSEVKKF